MNALNWQTLKITGQDASATNEILLLHDLQTELFKLSKIIGAPERIADASHVEDTFAQAA